MEKQILIILQCSQSWLGAMKWNAFVEIVDTAVLFGKEMN